MESDINHRRTQLDFHIKTGDYFPFLATIFGFVQETVTGCDCSAAPELVTMEALAIKNAREDLAYLHENYHIIPKTKADQ